jgi:hypothetical protein
MKDPRPLHHFLVITIEHRPDGLFLHQRTYTLQLTFSRSWRGTQGLPLRTSLNSRALQELSST